MILRGLGWSYYNLGDLRNAEKYFKEAIKNDPLLATLYSALGKKYYDDKSPEKCIHYYSISLLIGLDSPESRAKFKSRIMEMKKILDK
jgi:tetratricopeptide (TPR) repeat protein